MGVIGERDRWKVYGPYVRKNDGRKAVVLQKGRKRSSMSYARYLLEIKINRFLLPEEHADHIDENPYNDDPANLQILSQKENTEKYHATQPDAEVYNFICPVCGKPASKSARRVRDNRAQGKDGPFCSKSCAGKWTTRPGGPSNNISRGGRTQTHCKRGHAIEGDNISWNGKYKKCKICAAERMRKYRQREN